MKNVTKRLIAIFLAVVLIIPLNVGSIFAAETQRDDVWTVQDVGDETLYNFLVALYPSKDGLLYKADTENFTRFSTNEVRNNVYAGNYLSKVKSFANLNKVCPNITEFNISSHYEINAFNSLIDVLSQYVKDGKSTITDLTLPSNTSTDASDNITDDTISKLEILTSLTKLSMNVNKLTDQALNQFLSKVGTNIDEINLYGLDETKNINFLNLKKLAEKQSDSTYSSKSVYLSGKLSNVIYQSLNKLNALRSLSLAVSDDKIPMDFSKLNSLESIYISDNNITELPDLSDSKATSVSLEKYSSSNSLSYVKGLKLNKDVSYRYLKLRGIDLSASEYMGWESKYNIKSLYAFYLEDCKLPENSVDITDVGKGEHGSTSSNRIYITDSGITTVKGLENAHNDTYTLNLSGNALTEIPDLSTWNELTELDFSNNKISKIEGLPSNIERIDLSRNMLSDVGNLSALAATTGEGSALISKYKNLSYLSLYNNQLTELPDLSKIVSLEKGSDFGDSYLNNLLVYGNQFISAEKSIKGKVSDAFYNDPKWINTAMAKMSPNGILYYEKLDDTTISYSFTDNNVSASLTTSSKEISISKEIIGWIKSKGYDLSISYLNPDTGINLGNVYIDGYLLDSDESFEYSFDTINSNPYMDKIKSVFQAGTVIAAFQNSSTESKRKGISINTGSVFDSIDNLMEDGKNYNLYRFDPEHNAYLYTNTINKTKRISLISSAIYFIVDADTDQNIGVYTSKTNGIYGYYKNIDDNTLSDLLDNYKYLGPNEITIDKKEFTISAEIVQKIKNSNRNVQFTYFDKDNVEEKQVVQISSSQIKTGELKISFPTITESTTTNFTDLSKNFTYGTPSKYFTITDPSVKTDGLYYSIYTSEFTRPNGQNYNLYVYDDQLRDFALIGSNYSSTSASTQLSNVAGTYFTVPVTDDTYLNSGVYSNYRDLNNEVISRQLKLAAKYSNVSLEFNVNSQIKLTESILNQLKTLERNLRINYISYSDLTTGTGKSLGFSSVNGKQLGTISGDTTLKYDDVQFSTGNNKLDAAASAYGTPSGYITVKGDKIEGITYRMDFSRLLSNDINPGVNFSILRYNSDTNKFDMIYKNAVIQGWGDLEKGMTYVVINQADYVTPGDPDKEPTQPSEPSQPTNPTKPSEPSQPTNPTKPSEPEQPTNPIEPSEPVEPTNPTEPTTPVQPTSPTESTTPTQPQNAELTVNNNRGQKSAPITYGNAVIGSAIVESTVVEKMRATVLPEVEVVSNGAPTVDSNLFKSMKQNHKAVTLGVTNENNQLQYSWTFNYDTLKNTDMTIDLSMKFDTDRKAAIEKITGKNEAMYLSFGYHGELPGPALMKTYVGNQYRNGDVVYLYYYNETSEKVEAIGGGGLTVQSGYVQYTITHCSVYFLSQETPQELGVSQENSNGSNGSSGNILQASAKTGDMTQPFTLILMLGGSALAFFYINKKRKLVK